MPLGGKKKKKGKKRPQPAKRKLRYREDGEKYAQVCSLLGDRRLEVKIPGEGVRKAHIPGRFRKRVWINKDNWILVQSRDCDSREDGYCDVMYVYNGDEVRRLERYGEIKIERSEDASEEDMFGNEFEELEEEEEPKYHKKRVEIEYPSSFTSSDEGASEGTEESD